MLGVVEVVVEMLLRLRLRGLALALALVCMVGGLGCRFGGDGVGSEVVLTLTDPSRVMDSRGELVGGSCKGCRVTDDFFNGAAVPSV